MKPHVKITLHHPSLPIDDFSGMLFENGCQGITEVSPAISEAFFPDDSGRLAGIEARLREMPGVSFTTSRVEERDWNAEWKKGVTPVRLTDTITVYPDWLAPPVVRKSDIIISPKMSFGTGHHETTRLCARLMETHAREAGSLLDIGTGSGILAIVASKQGIPHVIALDNDPVTLENVRENIDRNHCGNLHAFIGTLDALKPALFFDVVVANILRSTLAPLLPVLQGLARHRLILSGLLCEESMDFNALLAAHGFRLIETREENEWYALAAETLP